MGTREVSRRRFLGGAAAVGAALAIPGPARGQDKPVKLGMVLPFSGPAGGIGKEIEQGIMLALGNASMQGGGRKIEVIRQDDRNDAPTGSQVVQKFIESDRVDVIMGPAFSHVLLAMRKAVHDSKTIMITPNPGPSQLAGSLCSPYIVNASWVNNAVYEAMGTYMAKKGIKTAAIAAPNYAAGTDGLAGFKTTYLKGGGKVVSELLPPLNTTDFQPYLTQMKASGADAAFVFFPGGLGVNFVKQYDQAGLKKELPLYAPGFTVEQDVLPAQGDSALGVINTQVYAPGLDNPANRKFAPAYKARFGVLPSTYAMQGYDAAQLLVAALDATKGRIEDRAAFIRALETVKIDSPRGPFKIGPNHTPVQNVYVREVARVDAELTNRILGLAVENYYFPGEGCTLPG